MKKIRVAIVGYGNIGHYALEALLASPDMELAGVVRRNGAADKPAELANYEVVKSIKELKDVDVAILATPTRSVEEHAKECLALGINTVDSFDIHTSILDLRRWMKLDYMDNSKNPDTMLGPWVDFTKEGYASVKVDGVEKLESQYLVAGNVGKLHVMKADGRALVRRGIHSRLVYVELEEGFTAQQVYDELKADDYFAHDELHVIPVASVDECRDMGHGVLLERKGVSGKTQNQLFEFKMKINNPALTGHNEAESRLLHNG